jgi:ATP-dependent Clp protease ATP-binding subunit ClpC
VNDDAVRSEIRKLVEIGPAHEISADIPLTPRARKALQLAAEEAKSWHHSSPGAEHVFLGLLREGSGVAAVALKNLGVRLEKAREIISNEWL